MSIFSGSGSPLDISSAQTCPSGVLEPRRLMKRGGTKGVTVDQDRAG